MPVLLLSLGCQDGHVPTANGSFQKSGHLMWTQNDRMSHMRTPKKDLNSKKFPCLPQRAGTASGRGVL